MAQLTADERNIGEVFQNAPATTNNRQYFEPLRCDIEWWDLPKLEQLYSFSSWNPRGIGESNHIDIVDASVTPPGTGQYGGFYFRVHDTEKTISPLNVRKKGIVIIKVKKYEAEPYVNLMYGFINKVRTELVHDNHLFYTIQGVGSGVLFNERYINIRRVARMRSIDSDIPLFDDSTMQVRKLYKEILTSRDLYVVDDTSISEQINPPIDTTSLDESIVNDTVLAINEPYVQASHALNAMFDSIGADGGLDPYNKPYLIYPMSQPTGITIKRWDDNADLGLDNAETTSYFMDDWSFEMDWTQESGFANRLLAKSRVTAGSSTASTSGNYSGFENLIDMDIAQRIPPSPARFRDLALILTRVGAGTTNPQTKTLHGHIVEEGSGLAPTGPVVGLFDVPLNSIPDDNPSPIFLPNINFKRTPNPSRAHWIILYERGSPGFDDTINWYYNTSESLSGNIARRPRIQSSPWTVDHNNNSGWEITTNNSFDFAFSILDNFTHIIIGEDVDSQERYGVVEDMVDVSFTTNTIAANKFLGEILAIRSMPKITYSPQNVTIPGRLFMPGITVRIEDVLADLSTVEGAMAEITSATYAFGKGSQSPLGAITCDIGVVGHYDFKVQEESSSGTLE